MTNLLKINKFFLIFLIFFAYVKESFGAYLIRDTETEDYVRTILDEILIVAEIQPKTVKLYILKDDSMNAFVYGGPNVFINTGLIQSAENYEVIQAVLAHEIGHLKAMHILRFNSNVNKALLEALFYSVSAGLLAIGGGPAAASIVALSVGANVAEKSVLKYTRAQEMEADYYAAKFLKTLQSSGKGAEQIFEKFEKMQIKAVDFKKEDEYRITHPFPKDRLAYMKSQFANLPYKPKFSEKLNERHQFITAKLGGYFGNLQSIYSKEFFQNEKAALYFHIFSDFRKANLSDAESKMKSLLKSDSLNPYFYESLGEIYFAKGDFNNAILNYEKANKLKPKKFNILFAIAESYFANKNFSLAIKFMNEAFIVEPYNPLVPYKLANYHDAKMENEVAKIYFIESEILRENYSKANLLFKNLMSDLKEKNVKLDGFYLKKIDDIKDVLSRK